MNNKYMAYEEYLYREDYFNKLKNEGVGFIFKKNWLKICLGVGCIVIGIIPNGLGFIFYPLGFYLLGIGTTDIFRYKENFKQYLYFKYKMLAVRCGFKK